MSIRLKVARSAKELNDVFELRYSVYVKEKKRFATSELTDEHIVDRFDAIPGVANVVAYSDGKAIATMRINQDSPIGLPAEDYFDFSQVRQRLEDRYLADGGVKPVIVGGSMLAVHADWRNRRDVIFALFKVASGVAHDWRATHGIGSISEETFPIYSRIGFEAIESPRWDEKVSDTLVPIFVSYQKIYDWTFGGLKTEVGPFWLDNFCGQYERLLLAPGDVLFSEGEVALNAYAIDEGWMSISRIDQDGNEMVFAHLSKGALFGELAILDEEPRSASATALTNVGLIVLERERLLDTIRQHPEKMGELLRHFSKRLRDLDDLTMVQAFAPHTEKMQYALSQLWTSAIIDRKDPSVRVAKVGVDQIAKLAQVTEQDVLWMLEAEKMKGRLSFGKKFIKFYQMPVNDHEAPQT